MRGEDYHSLVERNLYHHESPPWQVSRQLPGFSLAVKMNGTLTSRQLHEQLQDAEAKRNGLVQVVVTPVHISAIELILFAEPS